MFDHNKIDSYFNEDAPKPSSAPKSSENRHSKLVRLVKLTLPAIAAILASLLLILPLLQSGDYDFRLDITKPKAGEMEKLHIENTVFNITDKDNQVQNFTATNIDETEPGSKVIKLTNPEGTIPQQKNEWINLKSPTGYFNQETNIMDLTDGVEMFYSEGMNIEVFDANFNFDKKQGHSKSPVSGQGLFGDITSEGFDFYSQSGILIFNGKTNIKVREDSLKARNN